MVHYVLILYNIYDCIMILHSIVYRIPGLIFNEMVQTKPKEQFSSQSKMDVFCGPGAGMWLC